MVRFGSISTACSATTIMNKSPPPSPPPAGPRPNVTIPAPLLYGSTIVDLAEAFGIQPLEVALMAASTIGNLAGPKAAILDLTGRRVVPGFNIVQIGEPAARFQAIEARLMEPVRTSQDWIRKAVSGCSRRLVDMWDFGWEGQEKNLNGDLTHDEMSSRTRRHDMRKWSASMLESGVEPPELSLQRSSFYELPRERPRAPGPGVFQLPSVFLEGLRLDEIVEALGEVHSQRALVFDPAGKLWELPPNNKRSLEAAKSLAGLLRGQDCRLPRVHPNQGHGTIWHAKVGILSTMTMDLLGQLVGDDSHPQMEALEHCLLIQFKTAGPNNSANPKVPSDACKKYSTTIATILGQRLRDADLIHNLMSDHGPMFARFQENIFEACEQTDAAFSRHVVQFHDLAYRILWAFLSLRKNDPPTDIICGAFSVARFAIHQHVKLLVAAKKHWADRIRLESAQRVEAIVKRKGPSSLRDMLRSTNIQRSERLLPGIELLTSRQQLRQDHLGKYHLVESSPSREKPVTTMPSRNN